MSIAVPRQSINSDQVKFITDHLHIQEAPKFQRPSQSNNFYYRSKPATKFVDLYMLYNDQVYLPYVFGRKLFPDYKINFASYYTVNITSQIVPRPEQISILNEVWQQINTWGTANINVYTGCGKTMMGVSLASQTKLLTCIVCTNIDLITQWVHVIEKFTDASVWVVGKKPPASANIVVTMVSKLPKIPADFRKKIGCLIIDEAHTFCTDLRASNLLLLQPAYIISLTATPDRPDKMNAIMVAISGDHNIVRKMPKPIEIYEYHTNFLPQEQQNRDGTPNWESILKSIYGNKTRNNTILDYALHFLHQREKVLILSLRIEHTKTLEDICKERNLPFSVYCGKNKNFQENILLLGTISKIGTGFDESNLCEEYSGIPISVVIICQTIRSPILTVQCIGRATRASHPKAVIFIDSHRITQNQIKIMRRTLKKEYLQPKFIQL